MNKINDILAILAVGICSVAAFICLQAGSFVLAAINAFFVVLHSIIIYNRLFDQREDLDSREDNQ